jgi:hypothetical protein
MMQPKILGFSAIYVMPGVVYRLAMRMVARNGVATFTLFHI